MQNYSPAEPLTLATVLLVEASLSQAQALELALLDEPYEVLVASSVAEAMRILASTGIDVVLANQQLVGGASGELFGYLRQSNPAIIRILLVGDAGANSARRAVQTGLVHHYLGLPSDEGELALVLYNSLVQRSFLPPESEGILPTQAPVSSILPSRAPGVS